MRWVFAILAGAMPALATISGTVVNGTTGQPQSGITVVLLRMGPTGPEPGGDGKADAQGKFSLNAETSTQGPTLVRATLDGVTYTKLIPPGMPSEGLTLDIYNASPKPGSTKVSKHLIFFDPTDQGLVVNEAYLFSNDGKTSWNDPQNGTLRFYLPAGAQGKVQINATEPHGMPLREPAAKTDKPDIYKVNFPVRPGETRFDLSYTTPYTAGTPYAGKVASNDENTYLIVPKGVSLAGDDLNDMGEEPRTSAHIFGLKQASYKISLTGTADPSAQPSDASGDSGGQDQGSQLSEVMPRLHTQLTPILALAFGILTLGFLLLYRTPVEGKAGAGQQVARSSSLLGVFRAKGAKTKEPSERRRG